MFQEIAISPLFLAEIDQNEQSANMIIQMLNKEILLSDESNSILVEYTDIVPVIKNGYIKLWLQEFLNNYSISGKKNIIKVLPNIKLEKRELNKLEELKTEIMLVNANENSKIILSSCINKLQFTHNDKFKRELEHIELLTPQDYVEPNENSKILAHTEEISKKKGDYFNLIGWLEKFIDCTECIEIHDPFLHTPDALQNLRKILHLLPTRKERKFSIKIVTRSDEARSRNDGSDDIRIKKIVGELKDKFKNMDFYEYYVNKPGLNDRKIITDKFNINLGHALDAVKENNYVKKQFDIIAIYKAKE